MLRALLQEGRASNESTFIVYPWQDTNERLALSSISRTWKLD
jgi:hypothetical protein